MPTLVQSNQAISGSMHQNIRIKPTAILNDDNEIDKFCGIFSDGSSSQVKSSDLSVNKDCLSHDVPAALQKVNEDYGVHHYRGNLCRMVSRFKDFMINRVVDQDVSTTFKNADIDSMIFALLTQFEKGKYWDKVKHNRKRQEITLEVVDYKDWIDRKYQDLNGDVELHSIFSNFISDVKDTQDRYGLTSIVKHRTVGEDEYSVLQTVYQILNLNETVPSIKAIDAERVSYSSEKIFCQNLARRVLIFVQSLSRVKHLLLRLQEYRNIEREMIQLLMLKSVSLMKDKLDINQDDKERIKQIYLLDRQINICNAKAQLADKQIKEIEKKVEISQLLLEKCIYDSISSQMNNDMFVSTCLGLMKTIKHSYAKFGSSIQEQKDLYVQIYTVLKSFHELSSPNDKLALMKKLLKFIIYKSIDNEVKQINRSAKYKISMNNLQEAMKERCNIINDILLSGVAYPKETQKFNTIVIENMYCDTIKLSMLDQIIQKTFKKCEKYASSSYYDMLKKSKDNKINQFEEIINVYNNVSSKITDNDSASFAIKDNMKQELDSILFSYVMQPKIDQLENEKHQLKIKLKGKQYYLDKLSSDKSKFSQDDMFKYNNNYAATDDNQRRRIEVLRKLVNEESILAIDINNIQNQIHEVELKLTNLRDYHTPEDLKDIIKYDDINDYGYAQDNNFILKSISPKYANDENSTSIVILDSDGTFSFENLKKKKKAYEELLGKYTKYHLGITFQEFRDLNITVVNNVLDQNHVVNVANFYEQTRIDEKRRVIDNIIQSIVNKSRVKNTTQADNNEPIGVAKSNVLRLANLTSELLMENYQTLSDKIEAIRVIICLLQNMIANLPPNDPCLPTVNLMLNNCTNVTKDLDELHRDINQLTMSVNKMEQRLDDIDNFHDVRGAGTTVLLDELKRIHVKIQRVNARERISHGVTYVGDANATPNALPYASKALISNQLDNIVNYLTDINTKTKALITKIKEELRYSLTNNINGNVNLNSATLLGEIRPRIIDNLNDSIDENKTNENNTFQSSSELNKLILQEDTLKQFYKLVEKYPNLATVFVLSKQSSLNLEQQVDIIQSIYGSAREKTKVPLQNKLTSNQINIHNTRSIDLSNTDNLVNQSIHEFDANKEQILHMESEMTELREQIARLKAMNLAQVNNNQNTPRDNNGNVIIQMPRNQN